MRTANFGAGFLSTMMAALWTADCNDAAAGGVPGGRTSMHELRASAFPGAHLCHVAGYLLSNSAITPPAGGVWLDPSTEDGKGLRSSGGPLAGCSRR